MKSVFTDKNIEPTKNDLKKVLGSTEPYWHELLHFTKNLYPGATEAWHYSGEKYGWSFRSSDKKRVLIYLLPRSGYFKVAFVFGAKATEAILKSTVSEKIRTELSGARAYAEGRGIRIEVKDNSIIGDIKQLLEIKISH